MTALYTCSMHSPNDIGRAPMTTGYLGAVAAFRRAGLLLLGHLRPTLPLRRSLAALRFGVRFPAIGRGLARGGRTVGGDQCRVSCAGALRIAGRIGPVELGGGG